MQGLLPWLLNPSSSAPCPPAVCVPSQRAMKMEARFKSHLFFKVFPFWGEFSFPLSVFVVSYSELAKHVFAPPHSTAPRPASVLTLHP